MIELRLIPNFDADAFAWLSHVDREITSLKRRETKLKSQLMVFDISQPDSLELMQLEKV